MRSGGLELKESNRMAVGIKELREDGYAVVPDVVGAEEVV